MAGMGLTCSYCKKPCDGTKHDVYGEWVMKRKDLCLCDDCAAEFENEPGPWTENAT